MVANSVVAEANYCKSCDTYADPVCWCGRVQIQQGDIELSVGIGFVKRIHCRLPNNCEVDRYVELLTDALLCRYPYYAGRRHHVIRSIKTGGRTLFL